MNQYVLPIIIFTFIVINFKRQDIIDCCYRKNTDKNSEKKNEKLEKLINTIGPSNIVKELELKKYI
jgi:hypothetical protein